MDLNVQDYLGFDNLQTAFEEGKEMLKKIKVIKLKYTFKRKLLQNFLFMVVSTMKRRDINWTLKKKYYLVQCLRIFSRAAVHLGKGAEFVQFIDEMWMPIQEENFAFTIQTPPWAIKAHVSEIMRIITRVENENKKEKLFIQMSSPILNVLLLQPSFEVQIVMLDALIYILNNVSNVKDVFISLLRKFSNQEKTMRALIEKYLQTLEFTPSQSRQLVREINEHNLNRKIYTLICASARIDNKSILPCDDEKSVFIHFNLAHRSVSILIGKEDLGMIYGYPEFEEEDSNDILYIYFDCIQTISYYEHPTNSSLKCIEINFAGCTPLCYRANTSSKKLVCTLPMDEEELSIFLLMLQNFHIHNKLTISKNSLRRLKGIRNPSAEKHPQASNDSMELNHNNLRTLVMTSEANISKTAESENMKMRFITLKVITKPLDSFKRSSSLLTDEEDNSDDNLASAKKRRKLVVSSTPSERTQRQHQEQHESNLTSDKRGRNSVLLSTSLPAVSEGSVNRTPTTPRQLEPNLTSDKRGRNSVLLSTSSAEVSEGSVNRTPTTSRQHQEQPEPNLTSAKKERNLAILSTSSPAVSVASEGSVNRTPKTRRQIRNNPCIALAEQPEPKSFALNMSQNSQVSVSDKNVGTENFEKPSKSKDHSISSGQVSSDGKIPETVNTSVDLEEPSRLHSRQISNNSLCRSTHYNIDKQRIESPADTSADFAGFSTNEINIGIANRDKISLRSLRTTSQDINDVNLDENLSSCSRQFESRIVQIRSQDYSGLSSNSLDDRSAVDSKSSQADTELSDNNTALVVSNLNKISLRSQRTTSQHKKDVNLSSSRKTKSRIVQTRSQDYSGLSSNSLDNTSAVNAELSDKNNASVVSNPAANRNKISLRSQRTTSQDINLSCSRQTKSRIVQTRSQDYSELSSNSLDRSAVNSKFSEADAELSDKNTSSVVPKPVVTSPEASYQWQCGKHFALLTQSTSSDTQSSTENAPDNYTQYIQKLYTDLDKFTENTTINQEQNKQLHNKAMSKIFNALNSYNKFWCEQNPNFKNQFEQHQRTFEDFLSKF